MSEDRVLELLEWLESHGEGVLYAYMKLVRECPTEAATILPGEFERLLKFQLTLLREIQARTGSDTYDPVAEERWWRQVYDRAQRGLPLPLAEGDDTGATQPVNRSDRLN